MTFEDYWTAVERLRILPGMAIQQLPSSLSIETKKRLMRLKPEETAEMLRDAIEEVNHGSVESIESLVKRKFRK